MFTAKITYLLCGQNIQHGVEEKFILCNFCNFLLFRAGVRRLSYHCKVV